METLSTFLLELWVSSLTPIATEKYSKEVCGAPVVDRTKLVSIAGVTGGSLALFAFILRIWARLRGVAGKAGADDLCLFGTIVRFMKGSKSDLPKILITESDETSY
jgi:hypothetical protein